MTTRNAIIGIARFFLSSLFELGPLGRTAVHPNALSGKLPLRPLMGYTLLDRSRPCLGG